MQLSFDYTALADEQLMEMLFWAEDRLPLEAAEEIARRDSLAQYLRQVVSDKPNWLTELPEWWAVVHATYILAMRGTDEEALPMLSALRWSDAFDCDWVTELLPPMFANLGPTVIAGLTAVARDMTAGWSVRDIALKSMAAICLKHPDSTEHVFRIIGERFMDENEDRVLRQLAGQILLDFRKVGYRLALLSFAREELNLRSEDAWYMAGFGPEEVEWSFRNTEPELWHYTEDWTKFYDPAEIQRRQKRWARERLGNRKSSNFKVPSGGGHVLPLIRGSKHDDPSSSNDGGSDEPGGE